jgi:hypothetical protein
MGLLNWNNNSTEKTSHSSHTVLLPDQPEFLLKLGEGIVKQHDSKGTASPISSALAAEINFKVNYAKQKHNEGMKYLKIANEMLMERDAALGTRQGNSNEETSLKFYLQCAKDILALEQGDKTLAEWGFIVKK